MITVVFLGITNSSSFLCKIRIFYFKYELFHLVWFASHFCDQLITVLCVLTKNFGFNVLNKDVSIITDTVDAYCARKRRIFYQKRNVFSYTWSVLIEHSCNLTWNIIFEFENSLWFLLAKWNNFSLQNWKTLRFAFSGNN